MKQITNIDSLLITPNIHFYIQSTTEDYDIHYIGTVKKIINNDILETKISYYFTIPHKSNQRCFLYLNQSNTISLKNSQIFELSNTEFINTYISFMENDKKLKEELPLNVIKNT